MAKLSICFPEMPNKGSFRSLPNYGLIFNRLALIDFLLLDPK